MSGFRFPMQNEPTPPNVADPATPLQSITRKFQNKENVSEVSLSHKASVAPELEEAVTPDFFKKPLRVVQPPVQEDDLPTAEDLVNWKNPPASLFALLGGECLLFCAHWCFGLGHTTFLSGVCHVLLLSLALNFMRSCFSESWLRSSRWSGSHFERVLMDRMQDTISFFMVLRDETICAIEPWTMFKTAVILASGSVLGSLFSFWKLAMAGWALLFTIPLVKKHLGAKIAALYREAVNRSQEPLKKLKLTRQSKLLAVTGCVSSVAIVSPWSVRASMLLLLVILVRCSLKKDEVKYLRNHRVTRAVKNSPFLQSAFKASAHVTTFADDVLASAMKSAMKYVPDRTPEHQD